MDKILYIDDEQANLTSFKITFNDEYDVLLARNTAEAESLLKNNNIKLLISDQRMPDETGTDFINRIKPLYPDVVFIILTAFIDTDVVLDALHTGVYRFINKPWNEEEMKQSISNAIDKYNLQEENKELVYGLKVSNDELLRLAKKHRRNKRMIEENEKLLNAIFKNLPLIIILVDSDRRILKINSTGQKITGKEVGNITGLKMGDVFDCANFDKRGKHGISDDCYTCFMNNTIKNSFMYKTDYYKVEATIPIKNNENIDERKVLISTSYIEGANPMVLISFEDKNFHQEMPALKNEQ